MKSTIILYSALVIQESFSFTPSVSKSCLSAVSQHNNNNSSASRNSKTHTQLNLVPKQGCQLAAAQEAEFAKKKLKQSDEEKQIHPTDAARELVSRLFNKPFGNSRTHPQNSGKPKEFQPSLFKIPGIYDEQNDGSKDHDDVVLFPIVGFQYVKLQDGTMRGIPTINASPEKAVCSFAAKNKSMQQPVHGWYSQCCFLGDLYANDDEYCGESRYLQLEELKGRESEPHISEMLGWYKEYE